MQSGLYFILKVMFLSLSVSLSLSLPLPPSPSTNCECLLRALTVYDVLQLLGLLAFFFYVMFVRSQYLRVEQVTQ